MASMSRAQAAEVERLESEARAKAAKHVANMLARPDQLEKVEHNNNKFIALLWPHKSWVLKFFNEFIKFFSWKKKLYFLSEIISLKLNKQAHGD